MKTQKKLITVLTIFLSIVIVLGILLQSKISNNIDQLLQKRIDANKEEVKKLFLLEFSNRSNYVEENSFWNELDNAVNKKDTGWINTTLLPSISEKRYRANFLWIVDYDGKTITQKYIGDSTQNFKAEMPKNISLLDTLKSKIYLNSILKIGKTYAQICAAPIVQSNDHLKKTKPSGYLIVGKIIDSNYLNSITSLNSSFKYSLAYNDTLTDKININNAMITFSHKLKSMNAEDIYIKVNSNIPEVKVYDNFVKFSFAGYLVLIVIAGIALFSFFRKQFFYPLHVVSEAFANNSTKPILKLTTKQNEFGDLARMMKSFFMQKEILQTEINQRKKSELELITALDEKEKSFTEKEKAKQSEAVG